MQQLHWFEDRFQQLLPKPRHQEELGDVDAVACLLMKYYFGLYCHDAFALGDVDYLLVDLFSGFVQPFLEHPYDLLQVFLASIVKA
jgi:hypothetical protein